MKDIIGGILEILKTIIFCAAVIIITIVIVTGALFGQAIV